MIASIFLAVFLMASPPVHAQVQTRQMTLTDYWWAQELLYRRGYGNLTLTGGTITWHGETVVIDATWTVMGGNQDATIHVEFKGEEAKVFERRVR